MTIDQAHQYSKKYMMGANDKLAQVRERQWTWQYWLLIVSMILMYPTPIINKLGEKHASIQDSIDNSVFYLFWLGIYVAPENKNTIQSHFPLYIMILFFVLERISQRWQQKRYGCTLSKIREFKHLDEKLLKIHNHCEPIPIPGNSKFNFYTKLDKTDDEYLTIQEAQDEYNRIESLYRE